MDKLANRNLHKQTSVLEGISSGQSAFDKPCSTASATTIASRSGLCTIESPMPIRTSVQINHITPRK
eukprot:12914757-Prorocentrum_lima.AAC.1